MRRADQNQFQATIRPNVDDLPEEHSMTELKLEKRAGLPDALRVLLEQYPRADWTHHEQYHGLVSF